MAKQVDVVPFGATYSRAAGLNFKPCPSAYLTISMFAVLYLPWSLMAISSPLLCRMAKQLDVVPFGATYSRAAGLSFKPCPTAYLTISIFAVLHAA
jgi:ABC-type Fe3+-siderophore transport system permease subunit